jgi:hypothetical protein
MPIGRSGRLADNKNERQKTNLGVFGCHRLVCELYLGRNPRYHRRGARQSFPI